MGRDGFGILGGKAYLFLLVTGDTGADGASDLGLLVSDSFSLVFSLTNSI